MSVSSNKPKDNQIQNSYFTVLYQNIKVKKKLWCPTCTEIHYYFVVHFCRLDHCILIKWPVCTVNTFLIIPSIILLFTMTHDQVYVSVQQEHNFFDYPMYQAILDLYHWFNFMSSCWFSILLSLPHSYDASYYFISIIKWSFIHTKLTTNRIIT